MKPLFPTLLLLVCACTTPPQPPTLEEPKILELTFNSIGSTNLKATLHPCQAGLQLQTLNPRNDFTPNAISQSTFTYNGFRYLQATFQLDTGNSPSNYSLLGLVNSSSILGTAISSLKKYDGTNANPAIARQIMPLHAMKFDGVGIAVNPEIANFQIWSQAELPTAPAGSSLLKYGFVALPNQYYLTFAFKLPLQTPRSDDPFSFTMQFASYSDTENRVTESLEEQGASSGAAGRALAQNNASINTMPGSTIVSSPTVRKICSVKTALTGTYNSVSYPDVELYAPILTGCTP
jgi:hypothetical protein